MIHSKQAAASSRRGDAQYEGLPLSYRRSFFRKRLRLTAY